MTSTSKLQTNLGAVTHASDGDLRSTGIGQEEVPSHDAIVEERDVDFSQTWLVLPDDMWYYHGPQA